MTVWLWIIGAMALIWPVIWTHFAEGSMIKNFEIATKIHQDRDHIFINRFLENSGQTIGSIRRAIEQNDEISAVLWEQVFGREFSEGIYVEGRYVATTYDYLKIARGIRPPWAVRTDQVLFQYDYLTRNESYTWGQDARWLRRSDGNPT